MSMDGLYLKKFKDNVKTTGVLYKLPSPLQKVPADRNKMEQLSGVMIIIIIGGGVLTFVMLFIFAKRQIMRFTLRSRRGPHVPVGNDAKKTLRREIERRLDCIQKIAQEPKLLWNDDKYILQCDKPLPPYYYRMQAVDDVKILEREIAKYDGSTRHPYDNLRAFLLTTLSSCLTGTGQRMIHQFCDMYEHARHDPNEFGCEEYEAYHRLLLKLIEAAKQLKPFNNSRKSSPARSMIKPSKMPSLLDPSRLKPPPASSVRTSGGQLSSTGSDLTAGHQSKVNLTLGLHGRDIDGCEIVTNPLHLQTPADRDIIIRNRIKTPTLDDIVHEPDDEDEIIEGGDDEIMSISSVKFNDNSSVV
ncbi:protein C1orf43 homolog [Lucilia cuprina]|uniref:protein C1orf43 homolog n=1 Tax=Lucilia cuprina TaxID=7375 RepID=UPI001F054183|nr:protein C1orf43 homolog [Lucilia cuprina]